MPDAADKFTLSTIADETEVDRIEAWCNDPEADCVAIVDFAVPALIQTIRHLRGEQPVDSWAR